MRRKSKNNINYVQTTDRVVEDSDMPFINRFTNRGPNGGQTIDKSAFRAYVDESKRTYSERKLLNDTVHARFGK